MEENNIQPMVNPTTNPITETSQKIPRSSHVLPVLLSSFITTLVLVSVYFLFLNKNLKSVSVVSEPTPTPIAVSSPSTFSSLPTGWTYQDFKDCNMQVPVPPKALGQDKRTWVTELGEADLYGKWKGKSFTVIHRNPEEASGFISGLITISCGALTTPLSNEEMVSELKEVLNNGNSKNNDPDFTIQILSSSDIQKWGFPTKEITFKGGMHNPLQKHYIFTNKNQWVHITSRSDSELATIKDETVKIFESIKIN